MVETRLIVVIIIRETWISKPTYSESTSLFYVIWFAALSKLFYILMDGFLITFLPIPWSQTCVISSFRLSWWDARSFSRIACKKFIHLHTTMDHDLRDFSTHCPVVVLWYLALPKTSSTRSQSIRILLNLSLGIYAYYKSVCMCREQNANS